MDELQTSLIKKIRTRGLGEAKPKQRFAVRVGERRTRDVRHFMDELQTSLIKKIRTRGLEIKLMQSHSKKIVVSRTRGLETAQHWQHIA